MPTPADLARIDRRLQRFWARHGARVDFIITLLASAAIAWGIGYIMGKAR